MIGVPGFYEDAASYFQAAEELCERGHGGSVCDNCADAAAHHWVGIVTEHYYSDLAGLEMVATVDPRRRAVAGLYLAQVPDLAAPARLLSDDEQQRLARGMELLSLGCVNRGCPNGCSQLSRFYSQQQTTSLSLLCGQAMHPPELRNRARESWCPQTRAELLAMSQWLEQQWRGMGNTARDARDREERREEAAALASEQRARKEAEQTLRQQQEHYDSVRRQAQTLIDQGRAERSPGASPSPPAAATGTSGPVAGAAPAPGAPGGPHRPDCPAGQTRVDGVCKCPPDSEWDGSSCLQCPPGTRPYGAGRCASPAGTSWDGKQCVRPSPPPAPAPGAPPGGAPPPAPDARDCQEQGQCSSRVGDLRLDSGAMNYCRVNKRGQSTIHPTDKNTCDVPLICKVCGTLRGELTGQCAEWPWDPGAIHGGWSTDLAFCDADGVRYWCVKNHGNNRSCLSSVP